MMRMNKFKWGMSALFCLAFLSPVYSQEAANSASFASLMNTDNLLLLVALFLLLPIFILSKTLFFAVKMFLEKNNNTFRSLLLPALLLLGASSLNAQTEPAVVEAAPSFTWLILLVIGVEVTVIAVLGLQTIKILKAASPQAEVGNEVATSPARQSFFANIWEKMNKFQPMEKEADIDTGHSYDGIRELDNITPPWFTAGFAISILFAIGYLWVYHVSKSAPNQLQEYQAEMAVAEEERKAFLASQANLVDETNVTYLSDAGDLAAGKKIFDASCQACHRADLGGAIGPNLTDEYWIHGGSVNDVFALIKYGAQAKGMMPWKDEYSPAQIAQVTSYILSMKGSNPPGAKEAQGDLYNPETATTTADSAAAPQL